MRRLAGAALCALLLACAGTSLAPIPHSELAPLLARAARARGLAFIAPVRAFSVPEARLAELLAREADRTVRRETFRRESELLVALGLAPRGFRLRASVLGMESRSLAGFYSPLDDRLYVVVPPGRGGLAGVLARRSGVLVHELGHALQAQHSRLLDVALGIESEQDLLFALSALLEGDALYTEMRDAQLQRGWPMPDAAVFARRFQRQSQELGRGVPPFVRESVLLPYPTGYRWVRQLAERGGTAALDAALADPPLSSAELLHPGRDLAAGLRSLTTLEADPARFAPDAGCRPLADASLGELGLRSLARAAGLAPGPAARVAAGWRADHAWLLHCGKRAVVAWLVALGSPSEARSLEGALAGAIPGKTRFHRLRLDRHRARLLLSGGLSPDGRRYLLDSLVPRHFAHLADWLRAHPEVLERARRLRRSAGRGD